MIPKILHFYWYGRERKLKMGRKCIKSWKKILQEYQFKEWNEENFDINCNQYIKEAFNAKRSAFVTDYVRLYALYTKGGIYMDTDIELLKPLNHNFAGSCIPKNILSFKDKTEKNLYHYFMAVLSALGMRHAYQSWRAKNMARMKAVILRKSKTYTAPMESRKERRYVA